MQPLRQVQDRPRRLRPQHDVVGEPGVGGQHLRDEPRLARGRRATHHDDPRPGPGDRPIERVGERRAFRPHDERAVRRLGPGDIGSRKPCPEPARIRDVRHRDGPPRRVQAVVGDELAELRAVHVEHDRRGADRLQRLSQCVVARRVRQRAHLEACAPAAAELSYDDAQHHRLRSLSEDHCTRHTMPPRGSRQFGTVGLDDVVAAVRIGDQRAARVLRGGQHPGKAGPAAPVGGAPGQSDDGDVGHRIRRRIRQQVLLGPAEQGLPRHPSACPDGQDRKVESSVIPDDLELEGPFRRRAEHHLGLGRPATHGGAVTEQRRDHVSSGEHAAPADRPAGALADVQQSDLCQPECPCS